MNTLPWDYIRQARSVSLSLADLFPRLSYSVIRQIASEHHETLFEAHNQYATQPQGEAATKDFILTHVFHISPYLLRRPEDFWREVLRLQHRGSGLPKLLAEHVAAVLKGTLIGDLPVAELLASKSYAVRVVQDAWRRFLLQYGVQDARDSDAAPEQAPHAISLPFEHPDVRSVVDTMFLEGTLRPVAVASAPVGVPDRVKVGLVEDPRKLGDLVRQTTATWKRKESVGLTKEFYLS